jgi:hypothetical protein
VVIPSKDTIVLHNLRDISIILLALETIVIGIILLLLLWQVRLLVILLRDEVKPILKDAQETSKTVQSTTKFVSKRMATPAVGAISFMSGLKSAVKSLKKPVAPADPLAASARQPDTPEEEDDA